MTFKVSLALALLTFILQIVAGAEMLRSATRTTLYFIIFYLISIAIEMMVTMIKATRRKIEIEEKEKQEKMKEGEEETDAVSKTLLKLLQDSQIS